MPIQHSGIQTLLMDLTSAWGPSQRQALALALVLRREGYFVPMMCCPPTSPLARAAQEAQLPLLPMAEGSPRHGVALLRLWLYQSRHRPLLVHTFSHDAAVTGALLSAMRRKGGTLHIHTCCALPENALPPRVLTAWQQADNVLCADASLRTLLIDKGLEPDRVVVVHPGLYAEALPRGVATREKRFIFVAMAPLESGSGIEVLLRAMAALWQRTDLGLWEVRVAGQGSLFSSLLDEARSLGVESRLALLGQQPTENILPLCHALVIPSTCPHGNWEALASAWCVGLPVICSQVPTHIEVVHAGHNALVVPPGDPQALAAAMIRIMGEGDLRQRLTTAGWCMRPYISTERMARQCVSLYTDGTHRRGWVHTPADTPPHPEAPFGAS